MFLKEGNKTMTRTAKYTTLLTLLTFTACVPTIPSTALNQATPQTLVFKTSQANFMHDLKKEGTVDNRNAFIDEFIFQSNMQCQNYLNNPLKKPETDESKTSLYMNLFDSVAALFGISLVTNTAKAVFLENNVESEEEKQAFAHALSPEIRKGVELGRSRYAKTMMEKKKLDLKSYSLQEVKADTIKYDKQCNDAYGLIEINRALKEMQMTMNQAPSIATPSINPNSVKEKVIEATKEVEEKKEEKKLQENSATENNTTKVLPTQPTPVNVPLHHGNVPPMPHSIQL
jgi:ribosomal protein L14E/L6E/L27E